MERALSKETPFFGTFRSKEVWLDPFEFMLRYPERFAVSDAAAAKIRSEMMRVGEPGPGPRRLLRWAGGGVVSKKPFTEKEKTQYAHLIDELHSHLEARYQIKGTIQ